LPFPPIGSCAALPYFLAIDCYNATGTDRRETRVIEMEFKFIHSNLFWVGFSILAAVVQAIHLLKLPH
jgi:hypothetical protein